MAGGNGLILVDGLSLLVRGGERAVWHAHSLDVDFDEHEDAKTRRFRTLIGR